MFIFIYLFIYTELKMRMKRLLVPICRLGADYMPNITIKVTLSNTLAKKQPRPGTAYATSGHASPSRHPCKFMIWGCLELCHQVRCLRSRHLGRHLASVSKQCGQKELLCCNLLPHCDWLLTLGMARQHLIHVPSLAPSIPNPVN